jgi:hypothetical protein
MLIVAQLRMINTKVHKVGRSKREVKHVDNVRYTWDDGKLRRYIYRYRSDRVDIQSEHKYIDPCPDLCTFLDQMGECNKKGQLTIITMNRED